MPPHPHRRCCPICWVPPCPLRTRAAPSRFHHSCCNIHFCCVSWPCLRSTSQKVLPLLRGHCLHSCPSIECTSHQVPLLVHGLFKEPKYLGVIGRRRLGREGSLPDFYSILVPSLLVGFQMLLLTHSVLQRFRCSRF